MFAAYLVHILRSCYLQVSDFCKEDGVRLLTLQTKHSSIEKRIWGGKQSLVRRDIFPTAMGHILERLLRILPMMIGNSTGR
jgi:hypothetical protein